jgi:DNA-directed RNA polymerase sigma subunit (sigma70/sigma32)
VVQARFGFDVSAEKLSEVGERLGVSAERVRQIEERALAKLRRAT